MSNVKNYTEQGGERTVIGGELIIADGCKMFFGDEEFTKEGVKGDKGDPGVVTPAALQAASTATTVADLKTDFNALLAKLKTAGLMADE